LAWRGALAWTAEVICLALLLAIRGACWALDHRGAGRPPGAAGE